MATPFPNMPAINVGSLVSSISTTSPFRGELIIGLAGFASSAFSLSTFTSSLFLGCTLLLAAASCKPASISVLGVISHETTKATADESIKSTI